MKVHKMLVTKALHWPYEFDMKEKVQFNPQGLKQLCIIRDSHLSKKLSIAIFCRLFHALISLEATPKNL